MKVEDSDELLDFGVCTGQNPDEVFSNYIFYLNEGRTTNKKEQGVGVGKSMDFMPNIQSVEGWILDYEQTFHDGIIFNLLKHSLKNIKLKQTTDFVGQKCFDTMKELARHFGFDEPKEEDRWLFELRVSDLKHLTPMIVYAHSDKPLYNEQSWTINKKLIDESVKLVLTTRFDGVKYIMPQLDISENFELASPIFSVLVENTDGALKLLREPKLLQKCKIYIKELSIALLKQADIENTKKFKESDVLEYFAKNKKMRQIMSYIMEQHLLLLNTCKPEIIQNYKYYQEFLKLCKDDEPLDLNDGLNGMQFSVNNF